MCVCVCVCVCQESKAIFPSSSPQNRAVPSADAVRQTTSTRESSSPASAIVSECTYEVKNDLRCYPPQG